MNLYSTNNPKLKTDFKDAVFNSLPQDGGLYMPDSIPRLPGDFINKLGQLSLQEIAYTVAETLLQGAIPKDTLRDIINDAINFPAPVVALNDGTFVLELFHGPSLAFKDFGARFMSRVMSHFLQDGEKTLDIVVATSGDTGGAVALGFLGVKNTRVTILYPRGKVSPVQELQLTTNGENVRAIAIDGTFDDCQALVKQAFVDKDLNEQLRLTSANSINIARLIPQTFYYFYAYAQLSGSQSMRGGSTEEIVFAVPSGNFGNLGAGLIARRMGLPVKQFLAATNANDTVPVFLETGNYKPKPSVQTWANAMDVGSPSNWVRIMELFKNDTAGLKKQLTGYRFSDDETVGAIAEMFEANQYIVCPHTAISWLAARKWKGQHPGDHSNVVFLSTAHPCKFPEVFPENIKNNIRVPSQVKDLENKGKTVINLGKDYEKLKEYLVT